MRKCLKKVGRIPRKLMKILKSPFRKAGIYLAKGNTVENMQGVIDCTNEYLSKPKKQRKAYLRSLIRKKRADCLKKRNKKIGKKLDKIKTKVGQARKKKEEKARAKMKREKAEKRNRERKELEAKTKRRAEESARKKREEEAQARRERE